MFESPVSNSGKNNKIIKDIGKFTKKDEYGSLGLQKCEYGNEAIKKADRGAKGGNIQEERIRRFNTSGDFP